MDYNRYIIRDPKICGGEPVVKGTRVTIRTILASLAEGAGIEEILKDFQTLKEVDIRIKTAYKEFEGRLGHLQSPKGEKTGLVLDAIDRAIDPFRISEIQGVGWSERSEAQQHALRHPRERGDPGKSNSI